MTAAERALAGVARDLRAAADAADRGDLPALTASLTDTLGQVLALAEGRSVVPGGEALNLLHAVPAPLDGGP